MVSVVLCLLNVQLRHVTSNCDYWPLRILQQFSRCCHYFLYCTCVLYSDNETCILYQYITLLHVWKCSLLTKCAIKTCYQQLWLLTSTDCWVTMIYYCKMSFEYNVPLPLVDNDNTVLTSKHTYTVVIRYSLSCTPDGTTEVREWLLLNAR
jgi:hypothetical protein